MKSECMVTLNRLKENELYRDREHASKELLASLPFDNFQNNDMLIVAVSNGGAYFAKNISKHINKEMDILLAQDIVAPENSSVSIAVITETEDIIIHRELIESFDINEDFIYSEAKRKYNEDIMASKYILRKGKDIKDIRDKDILLVDDSIETGLSMYAAIKSMITLGARSIYVTVPVLDKEVCEKLLSICDGIYSPHKVDDYVSIEYYYQDFTVVTDKELELYS